MSSDLIQFPLDRVRRRKSATNIDAILSQDPYFEFILNLLTAIEKSGIPMDKAPEIKARELYAKYQRENTLAMWKKELEQEARERATERATEPSDKPD